MVDFLHILASSELEETLTSLGIRIVGISALALIVLVIIGALIKDKMPSAKLPIFSMITFVIVGATGYLFGSTIYLNIISDTGGPVHWHADIEYWACDNEIELRDPYAFLSNKIGNSVLHEHDDKRIHLEGVVVERENEATLEKFQEVVGGSLTQGRITIPVNEDRLIEDDVDGDQPDTTNLAQVEGYVQTTSDGSKYLELTNSMECGDNPAEVQVFVYNYNKDDDTYTQRKLEDPAEYQYYENPNVPPGDCIIFDFDEPKDFTDRLCSEYGTRDSERCLEFGVEEYDDRLCNIKDVTDYSVSSTRESTDVTPTNQIQSTEDQEPSDEVQAEADSAGQL